MKAPFLSLTLFVIILAQVGWAQEAKKGDAPSPDIVASKRPNPNLAARLFQIPDGLNLSEAQKEQVIALTKEYEPKLAESQAGIMKTLSKEQREARSAAFRNSRAAPDGKPIRNRAVSQLDLSEEEEKRLAAIRADKNRIKHEALEKYYAILNDEQRGLISQQQGLRKNRRDARVLLED